MTSLTFGLPADLEQLGAVVERLPIGVIVFAREQHDVLYSNRAARRLLHPLKLRDRRPLPDPWPSCSLPEYAKHLVDLGVGPDQRVQVDDDHVYMLSGITARGSNSAVLLVEDISDRERRARAEREFVSNAAHELLTPLTGIVSAAHVLEAGAKEVPEDRDKFIAHIAHECSRLSRIARSLLVLARAQSGEEPPRLEILRICELLDHVVGHLGTEVTVHCDEALTVLADEDLFVQAAANLVSNALRHGATGEALVEAREVGSNKVQIDIADTGERPSEFRESRGRFRSAEGRDGGGFGLGLSIAAQSLEAMGGRLLFNGGAARIELPRGRVRR